MTENITIKAIPTNLKLYGKHSTIVEYEYRGYKYDVEYSNDNSYCITKPSIQHKIEQEKIDARIEQEKNRKHGESAEVGFDLFWDYVNGDDI